MTRTEPLRLLLLDDNSDYCWATVELGSAYGLQVETAGTCDDARALLEQSAPFDLIVCDFNLERGETSEALVRDLCRAGAPVVVLTGNVSRALAALGPDACVLCKPARFDELVTRADASRRATRRRAAV